jgi:hypothetical protein
LFRDARLKIDRADKHISDVQAIISSLPDRDIVDIEIDPKTGGRSIKHHVPRIEETLTEVSLIAGDAIHNLRTSLDYSWMAIIQGLNLPRTRFTKFPFSETEKALEDTLFERYIKTVSPRTFQVHGLQRKAVSWRE